MPWIRDAVILRARNIWILQQIPDFAIVNQIDILFFGKCLLIKPLILCNPLPPFKNGRDVQRRPKKYIFVVGRLASL